MLDMRTRINCHFSVRTGRGMAWDPSRNDRLPPPRENALRASATVPLRSCCTVLALVDYLRLLQHSTVGDNPPSVIFLHLWSFTTIVKMGFGLWDIGSLIIAVAIPVAVGFIGTAVGGGGDSDWYKQLNKPSWTPPNWVFPVMWTTLYVLLGIASWLVWKEGGFEHQSYPLAAYVFQLLLNFLWTPIFFRWHRFDLALVEIVILWLAIAVTIYLFWHVQTIAAYLLVPYILWVTVATALTWYIWLYNGPSQQDITQPLQPGGQSA